MVNTAEKQQHAQDERIILSMFTCDIPCIAWHLFENWWTLSRTARWIGVPRGAHQTVRQPRPESLDTVSHQTGRCFLGHLTIRCRMPALVLFAMMHQLCNGGHYNDLWMGRRVTDSRLVAAVQLVSAGRTPGRWYARLAPRMGWTRNRAPSWLPSASSAPPNRRSLAPLHK